MFAELAVPPSFLAASLLLAVTPGPGVVYIVSRSLAHGRASGLASVLGVAFGNFANAVGAAMGLAALFAASAAAFTVVKWLGAAYLVFLGIRMWLSPTTLATEAQLTAGSLLRVFADGFTVALLNPKTALFFAAFLPQFLNSPSAPFSQSVVLGGVFVGIALCTDAAYALATSYVAPLLANSGRLATMGNRLAGTSLIGLGILTAMGSRPQR